MKQQSRLCGAVLACVQVTVGFAIASPGATAQGLEDFVLSGDAARRALTRIEISADTAERITESCVDS